MRKTDGQGWERTCPGSHSSRSAALSRGFICLYLLSKEKGGAGVSPEKNFESVRWANPPSSVLASCHLPEPTSGSGLSSVARGALPCSPRVRVLGRPRWTPGQEDSEEQGVLGPDITDWRSLSPALWASWGPSSTSRCLRNVLSWELPRVPSPPPAPHPPAVAHTRPRPLLPPFPSHLPPTVGEVGVP